MKRTIRHATFETNSSSSHSLVWGEGPYDWPYDPQLPEYPDENDYSGWEAFDEALDAYRAAYDEALPVSSAPSWDMDESWEKTSSGEDWPVTTYTLEPDTFNKLTALIWLVNEREGVIEAAEWRRRLSEMFAGADTEELFQKVTDWDGQYIEARESADILSALRDDDEALARFLFDDETTIVARYFG